MNKLKNINAIFFGQKKINLVAYFLKSPLLYKSQKKAAIKMQFFVTCVRKVLYCVRIVSDGISKVSYCVEIVSDGVRNVSEGVRKVSDCVRKVSDGNRSLSHGIDRCQIVLRSCQIESGSC